MPSTVIARPDHLPPVSLEAEALIAEFRECAGDVAKNLRRMAEIVGRLDELGIKLSINHPLLPFVRMISKGLLDADCFLACAGDPLLLELSTKLDPELQQRVANNESFEVLQPNGKIKSVPLLDMNRQQIAQVFDRGKLRTDRQQLEWLDRRKPPASRSVPSGSASVQPKLRKDGDLRHEGSYEEKPSHAPTNVFLDWTGRKIISAALAWRKALREMEDDRDVQVKLELLDTAIDDYLEVHS